MDEKKAQKVPVNFEMPYPYRNRLNIMRLEGNYKNLGEMIMEWIDRKAQESKPQEK